MEVVHGLFDPNIDPQANEREFKDFITICRLNHQYCVKRKPIASSLQSDDKPTKLKKKNPQVVRK